MPDDAPRFDLIVIGAGINGAAIAREAALAGSSVLLLEKDDVGAGTSAASTRLIHGGLRYLEHAEFSLVAESLHERERLLELASHLVEPLALYLPIYRGGRRARWQIRAGLWLYDRLSRHSALPRHAMLDRDAALEHLPGLEPRGLVGAATYRDAQVRYAERLVVENVLDAIAHGAVLHTRAPVSKICVEAGRVTGVRFAPGGEAPRFARAGTVINAAGPWVDRVLDGLAERRLIGGTKGSHLVVAAFPGAPQSAVYTEAASDGRPFFIVPWNGLYLIGTTDERFEGDPGEAGIDRDEGRYLVEETERVFPGAAPLDARVRYTQSGVRPLPYQPRGRAGAITRRHLIESHAGVRGLYSIVGGKLTTHRALAEDVMRRLAREDPAHEPLAEPGLSRERALPGALDAGARDDLLAALGARLGAARAEHLWRVYGGRAALILERARESAELAAPVSQAARTSAAELVHAIEAEWAHSLVDILHRRTMTGLDADFGMTTAPAAAQCLERIGLWDRARAEQELADYREYAHRAGAAALER